MELTFIRRSLYPTRLSPDTSILKPEGRNRDGRVVRAWTLSRQSSTARSWTAAEWVVEYGPRRLSGSRRRGEPGVCVLGWRGGFVELKICVWRLDEGVGAGRAEWEVRQGSRALIQSDLINPTGWFHFHGRYEERYPLSYFFSSSFLLRPSFFPPPPSQKNERWCMHASYLVGGGLFLVS